MLQGIDAATYQATSLVTSVLKGGAEFLIAKATEGQRSTDGKHGAHVAAARSVGKLVGHYHFAWLGQDPITEAKHFLAVAKPQPGDVLALDVEVENGSGTGQWPAVATRLKYTLAWLAYVKKTTGASPLLYSYISELNNLLAEAKRQGKVDELTSYPLWIADPSSAAGSPRVPGWKVWTIHQYSSAGGLDRNVLNGTAATWKALGIPSKTPAPEPQPAPAPTPAPTPTPTPPSAGGTVTPEDAIANAIVNAPVGVGAVDSPKTLGSALYRMQSELMRQSDMLVYLGELLAASAKGDMSGVDAALAKIHARDVKHAGE